MLQVLNSVEPSDLIEWLAIWKSWPDAEIFAHPSYLQLYTRRTTTAHCAVYEWAGVHILYPFLLRDLVAEGLVDDVPEASDITSAYGYGGPFVWGSDEHAPAAMFFWHEFGAWAARHHVVSEFVRFSVFREGMLPYPGTTELRSQNIVRTLSGEDLTLWMDFDHKVRKNVARARHRGVTVEFDADGRRLDDFLRIYYSTMSRRRAPARYYFPASYFQDLNSGLPGSVAYFYAIHNNAVIAAELVLLSARSIYSFLGGTDERYFDYRPNDLLKYEIILWAKRIGKSHFVLGGGYDPEDGIYRFKRSFAPTGMVPFFVGKRILSQDLYADLIAHRQQQANRAGPPWKPDANYFPAYRSQ